MSNQEYPPFGKSEGSTSLAIKIGLAVFLAILAVTAIRWLYANWVMQQAMESFNQSISQIHAQSQAQLIARRCLTFRSTPRRSDWPPAASSRLTRTLGNHEDY